MIDTKLLRQKLIDMAMRGLLVEQRPEEGNASDLLEQIRAEKAALIKKGQIKKEKPLPEIKEEEKPFAIPANWCWVRLGEICQIIGGFAFQSCGYVKQGVRIIRISDFNDYGFIDKDIVRYEYDEYLNQYEIQENDILLCMTGGTVGKNIIVPKLRERLFINQRVAIIRAKFQVLQKYIYATIRSDLVQKIINRSKNSLNDNISMKVINNFPVPLPPLAEQKRIVGALEASLKLVDTIAKDSADLDKALNFLRQKVLDMAMRGLLVEQCQEDGNASDLLNQIRAEKAALIKAGKIKKEKPLPEIKEEEKPFAIPANWCWVRLGDLCSNIRYGTSNKSEKIGTVIVLRMGNIQNGAIDYSDLVYTSDAEDIETYKLEYGDLLFNRTNSKELVGKTAIYKAEYPAIYAGYLVRVTTLIAKSEYLNFTMQSEYYKEWCRRVRSDGVNQSNINAEKLKKLLIPLPPLAEQKRIVAKIEQINALIDTMLN